ncbi:MAG: hypothetical protein E7478_04800 [Ruminococcaceae bacterium]|nr:hypothetical protein [Oscillospiraceae bacterium]
MDSAIIVAIISAASSIAVSVFSAVMAVYGKKHAKLRKEEMEKYERWDELRQNVAAGTQCLLRAEIIRSHEKYIDRGYCPVYAKESLTREYQAYHNLGGNDVATALYEQLMTLPNERRIDNEE